MFDEVYILFYFNIKDNQFIVIYKRAGVRLLRSKQWIFKFNSGQSYSIKGSADVEKI